MVMDEDTDSPAEKESQWDFTSQAMFEGWYPTLKKAIWLLSRIYRLVNASIPCIYKYTLPLVLLTGLSI